MIEKDKNHSDSSRIGLFLLGFVLMNLAAKGAMVRINLGEYTDGILQLNVLSIKSGLYPPLYGSLAGLVSFTGIGLETAARVISVVAGSLAVIPVFLMARRLFGSCAAKFAAILYTISPLPWRWSVRVMTDSLFLCLSAFALYFMQRAWRADGETNDARTRDKYLALASATGALATLTRYQGGLLAILFLIPLAAYVWDFRRLPLLALLSSLLWGLVPFWMHYGGFVHGGQFAERQAESYFQTLLAYWNVAESFVLIAPYYFAYPVFAFFLVGLLRANFSRMESQVFLWNWTFWSLGILAVQAAFGSFQYRYMMPLLPGVLVIAGGGCAVVESALKRRGKYWVFSALFMGTAIYTTLFSCAILVLQRKAFGDQRAAATYIRASAPDRARVFSNERYGNFSNLGSVKLSFWSGRKVESLMDLVQFRAESVDLPGGSYLVLSNAYGGDQQLEMLERNLVRTYNIREVASFDAEVYPLMDDVMVTPLFNQNPLEWVMRYSPQEFSTQVFIVDGRRDTATSSPAQGTRQ